MVESKHPQEMELALTSMDDSMTGAIGSDSVPVDDIVASVGVSVPSEHSVTEEANVRDILQQALEEVSSGYSGEAVVYGKGESNTVPNTNTELVSCSNINPVEMPCLTTVNPRQLVSRSEHDMSFSYFTDAGNVQHLGEEQHYNFTASAYIQEMEKTHSILPDMLDEKNNFETVVEEQHHENLVSHDLKVAKLTAESSSQNPINPKFTFLTIPPRAVNVQNNLKMAPLGSSQNPIRIIQQGNKYKSLQNLTSDQLAQIMQVVQQQQLLRSSQQTGKASVLYNPQTQTKIVFRVVYPAELHKNSSRVIVGNGQQIELSGTENSAHILKKAYHKRKQADEGKGIIPELSKQEKELRKKHRQRTRYGRLSRPPQYMVKDYKHIHLVDYDEDYDDSDGGYSDFKDDSSEEMTVQKGEIDHIAFGLPGHSGYGKPRKHKCSTCEKSYIGLGGLTRHYRLNPSHGNLMSNVGTDVCNSSDSFQSLSTVPCDNQSPLTTFAGGDTAASDIHLKDGCDANEELRRKADDTQVSVGNSFSAFEDQWHSCASPSEKEVTDLQSGSSTSLHKQRSKRGRRGRPPSLKQAERRKERLQELIGHCTDEELMEVVMPRLSTSLNLWEFLLMRTEQKTSQPNLNQMIKEFDDLRKQIATLLQTKLVLSSVPSVSLSSIIEQSTENDRAMEDEEESQSLDSGVRCKAKSAKSTLEIADNDLARCFGLSVGHYEVKDNRPLRQYKLLTSNPAIIHQNPSLMTLRTVELVPQEQLISLPFRKRLRLTETAVITSASDVAVNSCNTTSGCEWKNMPNCKSVEPGIFAKPEMCQVVNNESSQRVEFETTNATSLSKSLPTHNILTAAGCSNKKLIGLVSPLPSSYPCVDIPGSSVSKDYITSVSDGRGCLIGREGLPFDSEFPSVEMKTQSCVTFAANNLPCMHPAVTEGVAASDAQQPDTSIENHYYNGSLNETDCFSDRESSTLASVVSNNISSHEIHSVTDTSASENKSCYSVAAELGTANANFYSLSSHEEVEAKIAGSDAVRADAVVGNLQFIAGNLGETGICAASETDFISLPVQDFTQTVDKMVENQHLLVQDCEMGECPSNHQEILLDENAQLIQTNDGIIIIRNPDGTIQIHGQPGQQISFETVQALIGLEHDNQMIFENVQQT